MSIRTHFYFWLIKQFKIFVVRYFGDQEERRLIGMGGW